MQVEYSRQAYAQAREEIDAQQFPSRARRGLVPVANQDFCPRHGSRYVVRRGTNRRPIGRKRGANCR